MFNLKKWLIEKYLYSESTRIVCKKLGIGKIVLKKSKHFWKRICQSCQITKPSLPLSFLCTFIKQVVYIQKLPI